MLWTIAIVLIVLWALGFFTHVAGGLIHLLLVVGVILIVLNLVRRGRAGDRLNCALSAVVEEAEPGACFGDLADAAPFGDVIFFSPNFWGGRRFIGSRGTTERGQ